MYNKAKYLTSKIAGLIGVIFGGISIIISLLAMLTFTFSCSGENVTMTFPKLFYLCVVVAKIVFDVALVRNGIGCVKEPRKLLMNEDALTGLKYKWNYAPEGANRKIMIAAIIQIVLMIVDFLFVGVLATVFLYSTIMALVVYGIIYVALIALEIVTMNIHDYEIYDEKGNAIV